MAVNSLSFRPPVLVGERVAWLGSGSGMPQAATVRWIGHVPEITAGWTVGIELDRAMPVGGIDGTWRKRKLFTCEPKHGLLVPIDKITKESVLKTRHSIGEPFYSEVDRRPLDPRPDVVGRQHSLPQSASTQEFLSRVLPQGVLQAPEDPPELPLNFKAAADQAKARKTSLPNPTPGKVSQLSVANVRAFETLTEAEAKTPKIVDELQKFKLHLEALEKLKNGGTGSRRLKKVGSLPESLYASARPHPRLEHSLVLGLIGERVPKNTDKGKTEKSEKETDDKVKNARKPELKFGNFPEKQLVTDSLAQVKNKTTDEKSRTVKNPESEVWDFDKRQSNLRIKNEEKHDNDKKLRIVKSPESGNLDEKLSPTNSLVQNIYGKKSADEQNYHNDKTLRSERNLKVELDKFAQKQLASNSLTQTFSGNESTSVLNSNKDKNLKIVKNTVVEEIRDTKLLSKDLLGQTDVKLQNSLTPINGGLKLNAESKGVFSAENYGNRQQFGTNGILDKDSKYQRDGVKHGKEENVNAQISNEQRHTNFIADVSVKQAAKTKTLDKKHQNVDEETKKISGPLTTSPGLDNKIKNDLIVPKKNLDQNIKREIEETIPEILLFTLPFERQKLPSFEVIERVEETFCTEVVESKSVEVLTAPEVDLSEPTPTIRKKRQQESSVPPVPIPRKRQTRPEADDEEWFDTTSVLYEPAFLKNYEEEEDVMTDFQGRFRRIDEDAFDRTTAQGINCTAQGATQCANSQHRVLCSSASAPVGNRKGIFSFLRWFRKNKAPSGLDLSAFASTSVNSSPVFARSRISQVGSVDTLYSLATVSSFAFVPASQYQKEKPPTAERRKKRRAPPPPGRRDSSLPNTLEARTKVQHRRTASESYKDRKSGSYTHVHGKRKAPPPPVAPPRLYPTLSSLKDSVSSQGHKKRPAPLPPEAKIGESPVVNSDDAIPNGRAERCENGNPVSTLIVREQSSEEAVVCNDTLRLEKGVLKPNKTPVVSSTPDVVKIVPLSPVSPRPWYKRKSLEKRKEKPSDDWMPEVGFSRPLISPDHSPLKFFFSRGEDKKKEEKRKSGLSILANISELDREAAEICRKEQAHQEQLLAANDAKFYSDPPEITLSPDIDPRIRNTTRELISLFNTISGSPKLTTRTSSFNAEGDHKTKKTEVKVFGDNRTSDQNLAVAVSISPEIKTASVVGTKPLVNEDPVDQSLKVERDRRRQRSISPVSTIDELSEPSSSAATFNQYLEPVWTCTRCTLENLNWKTRCDACSACKPNYNPAKGSIVDRRRSEMELEIDWERELKKYFPPKKSSSQKQAEISAKLLLSKTGDVFIKTETNDGVGIQAQETDINEIRKKRLAHFIKSLGTDVTSSLRDAAAKKSLDESEKLKLKGMLKEMKKTIPKHENAINNLSLNLNENDKSGTPDGGQQKTAEAIPQITPNNNSTCHSDAYKYGAIRKTPREDHKPAEALLVTTTTVYEDIIVKKKEGNKDNVLSYPVHNFSTVGIKENGEKFSSLKKARKIGDGPFELMRARDLASIIHSKTPYPTHVYANFPLSQDGSDVERLTTAAGLAEFRAKLDPAATNTLAVNRLLRRLEAAIADGRHDQAATLARELAVLKVSCSVIRQKPSPSPSPTDITVELYVEDKISHQGPIPLHLQRSMTLSQLKEKVNAEFQIPPHVQRWILGKQLATEEDKTLEELGVVEEKCPVFLYLVAPDPEVNVTKQPSEVSSESAASSSATSINSPPRPLGKGWYFNYEEDRYSFCESDSDQSPEKEVQGHKSPDLRNNQGHKSPDQRNNQGHKSPDQRNNQGHKSVKVINGQGQRDSEVSRMQDYKMPEVTKVQDHGRPEVPRMRDQKYPEVTKMQDQRRPEVTDQRRPEVRGTQEQRSSEVPKDSITVSSYSRSSQSTNSDVEKIDLSKSDKPKKDEVVSAGCKAAAVRVIQRTIDSVREKSKSRSPPKNGHQDLKIEPMTLQPAPVAKPFSPKLTRPPLRSSQSLPEEQRPPLPAKSEENRPPLPAKTDEQRRNQEMVAQDEAEEKKRADAARPRSRSIFDLMKPLSNDTLKKDLKVISVNAVKETIEKLTRRTEDPVKNGWKCEVCTLLNAVTRPGCAACTAPRPTGYVLPPPRPVEEELRRLRRDDVVDYMVKEPTDVLPFGSRTYQQLVNLDSSDLVLNTEPFECLICLTVQQPTEGVVLRECLHTFCRPCLVQTVQFSEEAEVKCPFRDESYSCDCILQQREIKALVPRDIFDQHLARSVSQAESGIGNAFHCKTPDCSGWCIFEDNVNEFRCPVCRHTNCLTCQAIHEGMNCRSFQERLRSSGDNDVEAKRTRNMLEEMVQRGDAMACPTCQVVLMKKWGCDWLRCSMCKTEICWVTRGPRWGPAGKGDVSSGCQCGVNGVKCHPKCNYCH